MKNGVVLASLLAFAVPGCAARDDSPAYFERVTGIAICRSSLVRSRHPKEEASSGTGVIYSVRLRMTPNCERNFLRKVGEFQRRADPMGSGDLKGQWIEVTREDGWLAVLYTA